MTSQAQIIDVDYLSPESFKFLVEELHTFGKIELRGVAKTLACVISCIGFDKFPMKDVTLIDIDTMETYDVENAEEDARKMIITKKPDAIWLHNWFDHPVRLIRYEGAKELVRLENGELRTLEPLKKSKQIVESDSDSDSEPIRLTQPLQSGYIQPVSISFNLMAPKDYIRPSSQTITVDNSKVQIGPFTPCHNFDGDDEANVLIHEDGTVMEEVD